MWVYFCFVYKFICITFLRFHINHIKHYFSKSSNLRLKGKRKSGGRGRGKRKRREEKKKKRRLVLCRKMEKRGSGETRTALRENTWASSGGGRKPQAKTFQQTGKCAGPFPEAQETQAAACHKQRVFLAPWGSWQGLTKHKSKGEAEFAAILSNSKPN